MEVRDGREIDLRNAVRDDGVVDVVTSILVFGPLFVQARDLKENTRQFMMPAEVPHGIILTG